MAAFPGTAPVAVDAAGCGAALRDYGRLLGTPQAAAFADRVADVHEVLAGLDLPPATRPIVERVAIQDPCHLRHVQRTHTAVRAVLAPYVTDLVDLDDDGLCCGAGGAYSALRPELAASVRERKLEAIERSGATVVASANPGCVMHLAGALAARQVRVVHPVELIDQALRP
jgi:glycolate oxidase iron-sulfur subunit